MSEREGLKDNLLTEIAKCRCCRFCLDVCPTYQATIGVENLSSFGRIQILRYLLTGTLELDDSLTYALYSCLQCGRCKVVCKSKGQDIDITEVIKRGRSYLAPHYLSGEDYAGKK